MKLKNPNIAPLISVKPMTEYQTRGFRNTPSCVPYESRSRTGSEGMQNKVASSTDAFTKAKNHMATLKEV